MGTDPSLTAYQRNAAAVTDQAVGPMTRDAKVRRRPWRRAHSGRFQADPKAYVEAEEVVSAYERCTEALGRGLAELSALSRPRLAGKVEDDQARLAKAAARVNAARLALGTRDFGACGKALRDAYRELSAMAGPLRVALNHELGQAVLSRDKKAALQANLEERNEAQRAAAEAWETSPRAGLLASALVFGLAADGLAIAAQVLAQPGPAAPTRRKAPPEDGAAIVAPEDLESFADVGGLEEVKDQLRRTAGAFLERGAEANRLGAVHNGVLLYGPPGTGKTLLARAVAGEYGLRFLRFSPAAIASEFQRQPAKKLAQIFARAAASAPCLLFLDEVDAIAGRREGSSPDQRDVVTQLLNSLEEYRATPGLLIMAATNTIDALDVALREGRFDARIAVPLPDARARMHIFKVHLEGNAKEVAWDTVDLEDLAQRTAGRSGAGLAGIVAGAMGRALANGAPLTQGDLVAEIEARSGQDRVQTLEDQISWDDVVLPDATKERLAEILLVFQKPELGRRLGVRPPAGILLHGPPGTGKTTIARALASEANASFYDESAASLLSKWVGESEQKVAQLFERARNNRPSIIFCDEIDSLLKRRVADSSAPWEERVVSQFLKELDGLHSGEGVLLVGATNRADMIDDAVRERRLLPIEIPLPDLAGRKRLLEVLCREVSLGADVDLGELAHLTEGMSGADLKAIRNAAGIKALTRAAREAADPNEVAVVRLDFVAALADRGVVMRPTKAKKVPTKKQGATRVASSATSASAKATGRPKPSGKTTT